MNNLVIPIQDPAVIDLVHEIKNGQVPLSELHRKIGRYRTDKALLKCQSMILQLKIHLKEYTNDPLRCELEFVKECLGINNGREKKCYSLGQNIEVKHESDKMILLVMKSRKVN